MKMYLAINELKIFRIDSKRDRLVVVLFSRKRLRLECAQVVSCCVYEMQKQQILCASRVITSVTRKNRQMSRKMIDFDTFTKIA